MRYKVVESIDRLNFQHKIQRLVQEGWELQGGVSMTYADDYYCFAQAMIKKDR